MVRKLLRRGAIAALVVFALLQLKQPDRTNPPIESEVDAPPEVREILRRACYDCHSHETRWPWYSYVAPVSWWIGDHVEHARKDMNFSRWPTFDLEEQEHIFADIREEVSEGEKESTGSVGSSMRTTQRPGCLHGDFTPSLDQTNRATTRG